MRRRSTIFWTKLSRARQRSAYGITKNRDAAGRSFEDGNTRLRAYRPLKRCCVILRSGCPLFGTILESGTSTIAR